MNPKAGLQVLYSRIFFLRREIDRLLTLSMLFSIVSVIARVVYTGRLTFLFLIWNLFLAFVPWFISQYLVRRPQWVNNRIILPLLFVAWLAFVPNTFYILTDLYHLGDRYNDSGVPEWYDLAMILSFGWNGLLLGVMSVRHMEKIFGKYFPGRHELVFLYPVMFLSALGVYTGRYLRYNSWDVITNPFELLHSIGMILIHPLTYSYASGMVGCFSVLLTLFYQTLKKFSRHVEE